ncbi:Leucine-rich repeat serine/threonine-protein kinase 2 [Modicella reniformis]|uniref:Leucine-rich repeat serine/threonine-protein kinase 2 n=1 Tax=Modicella reniformis TaxID=1440133 RepID=A0A9P6LT28_9FUNG|nr:Leucine-rich repeat serine/threonine-protein kinase 2 [Modicella reniformis]
MGNPLSKCCGQDTTTPNRDTSSLDETDETDENNTTDAASSNVQIKKEKNYFLANEIPASEIKNLSTRPNVGGMGRIYLAEWKGQKVAIKEASTHVISKEASLEIPSPRLKARMKGYEGVVQFCGVTLLNDFEEVCIVTKYAEKGSLTWHLKVEYQNLTWDDKLRLATQMSTSIAHIHQEGIYHRDLHGGNILIDAQGTAMLTDFGASTIMEERVKRNIKEYALEVSEADGDIYSLGVLLWELTSGHSAFSKVPQDVHLAVAIMNGKRELPVEGTPEGYKALYEKCWQSDPSQRPTTDEILETLTKVRASMTPEQLADTRTRSNIQYESLDVYEESMSIPRPTSDIQQHFISE